MCQYLDCVKASDKWGEGQNPWLELCTLNSHDAQVLLLFV